MARPLNDLAYCENCRHFKRKKGIKYIFAIYFLGTIEKCLHPDNWESNYLTVKAHRKSPREKNKNNTCHHFEKK